MIAAVFFDVGILRAMNFRVAGQLDVDRYDAA
jgi:hypothetical protein